MKLFILLAAVFTLTISADGCKKKKSGVYKGKLEIKALCMNYTIRVLEGSTDTSIVTANWIDESTNKSYSNVFGLASRCSFPATIKEGDEFYFTIETAETQNCAVCMAYYPTPPKKLFIKVVEK
ncbi:MAG TPA: hypothetical protein VFZ42_04620 [Chitinophagaceae bacterium]